MANKRTDAHRPGAIVPGEYRYLFSYNLATVMGGWPIPSMGVNCELGGHTGHAADGSCCILGMGHAGLRMAATGGTGKCSICGAVFLYGDIWVHEPTGEHLHVGHTCADKYGMMADRSVWELEMGRRRAAAAVEIEKARRLEEREEFLGVHPGLREALELDHPILQDMARRFQQYRALSDRQVAFALKLADEVRNPLPSEAHVRAPEGRQTFQGKVVGLKTVESAYGLQRKVTVKVEAEGGTWLAWGTCPAALVDARVQRGDEVEVTATLKRGREEHFALMSRPSGRVLQQVTVAA